MKIKYLYQLLGSHISILIIALLVLSLSFTHYVENLVYENKVDELTSFGEKILSDFEREPFLRGKLLLTQYSNLLQARNTELIVFDHNAIVTYSRKGIIPRITLTEKEWNILLSGNVVQLKYDPGRFDQAVTLVALPYLVNDQLIGGILLLSPISGTREMISQINQYLLYTVLISLSIAFLLSLFLSKLHVKRIEKMRDATSVISTGNYDVFIKGSSFDEIGELASDFNQMVRRLKSSQEEIEHLENRRRQFMADVSHELRTPLTTISGVIEGIRNDMIPDDQRDKGFQLIDKEAKRLIRLVNENLDYEKIRSNQVILHKVENKLIDIFEIIKEQLSILAEEKGNSIRIEVDSATEVLADYDRLIQILMNITKNSIQFTSNGTIWLRGKIEQSYTVVEIEDTGSGIDPKEIDSIWRRFYKADLSRTSNPYGEFGLGLSIVKQLVQMHKGTIEVVSEKGKGTKFIIKLPSKET
ncbi:sensor histidine kinase [Bacillus salitolerans]|uniref:histidine kinase n=1 Tax=Bacillus salitolerans TaxID=1437434 RepID=A0ABW4LTK9_9BACI